MRLVKSRSFSFVLVSVQKEVIAMGRMEWIKKIMIIVLGSMLAAYGITLALYAGFGGATNRMARHVKNISYKYWYGFSDSGFDNDSFCIFL